MFFLTNKFHLNLIQPAVQTKESALSVWALQLKFQNNLIPVLLKLI